MWLPNSVYKCIPQFWFLLGLLFIAGGFLLGFNITISLLFGVIGILCCVYGIAVAVERRRHRPETSANEPPTAGSE